MRKLKFLYFLGIILLIGTTAKAAYWIYSNSVVIPVADYSLTLQSDAQIPAPRYIPIHLTFTLTFDNHPINSTTVYLFLNGTEIASAETDINGQAFFTYTPETLDTLNFTAGIPT